MKKNRVFIYNAIVTLILVLYLLVNSTNLSPLYYEGALFYAIAISIYIFVSCVANIGKFEVIKDANGRLKFQFPNGKQFPKIAKYMLIVVWVFIILMAIFSSPLISFEKYKSQMPDAQSIEFKSDMQPLDMSKIPIVDMAMAGQLADKKLGEKQSLGSQVNIGKPVIQLVKDKLVWVVPLHHSGFFKWLNNMSGTPGYIVVSATNTQDVEYVEGYKVKYHPNSFFFDDLTRYVRFKSSLFKGITDYSFELDDDGQPYWVVTTYKNEVGFALPEADGVLIVNATNGDIQSYGIDNVPSWIDRVQPENFILQQINNKGEYIRGILNFSNKDKYKTSAGHRIVYNDGRCYLITGLTSVGADESAIGFIMVDMVTKQPKIYQLSGATEASAQQSAQGNVQQYGYTASFPLILNFDGIPSYFMTLKDRSGLIKQYALVSIKDYLIVATGETVDATFNSYRKVLQNNIVDIGGSATHDKIDAKGKITRISSAVEDGSSIYYFILDSLPNVIFSANSKVSNKINLTRDGDTVAVSYYNSNSGVIPAINFDNLSISS